MTGDHSAEHGPESGRPQDFNALVAAGGWCAPQEVLYDTGLLDTRLYDIITFEPMTMLRGGIVYDTSPEAQDHAARERAAQEAIGALVTRRIGDAVRASHVAIENALRVAYRDGLDVHVHRPAAYHGDARHWNHLWGGYRFVGIEFAPRSNPDREWPVLHEHATTDDGWGNTTTDRWGGEWD